MVTATRFVVIWIILVFIAVFFQRAATKTGFL